MNARDRWRRIVAGVAGAALLAGGTTAAAVPGAQPAAEAVDKIDAAAKNLADTAGSQFPSEVSAVEADVTALDASVSAAVDKPTPHNVDAARTSTMTSPTAGSFANTAVSAASATRCCR